MDNIGMVVISVDPVLSYSAIPLLLLTASQTNQKKQKDLFSLMLEEVQDYAIFTLDPTGIIVSWNPSARSLIGYTKNEIVGQPLTLLFPDKGKKGHFHKDLQMALKKGQYEHITQVVKKNKEKISVKCVITALWGNDNKLKGFSKIVQDITHQLEAEKLREEFIAMAGHELKNPITSIKSYLQLIEIKLQKANTTEYVPLITKTLYQVDKLNTLIRDILDTSKITTQSLTFRDEDTITLRPFIKEIMDTLQVSYPARKILLYGEKDVQLTGIDRERLEQVFVNLFTNAIKYSLEKERITVTIEKTKNGAIIQVKDQGIGILKKELKNIFNRYFRGANAKKMNQGLGLGLHLSKAIIDHYKGKLTVESTKGKGSTFSVFLPASLMQTAK